MTDDENNLLQPILLRFDSIEEFLKARFDNTDNKFNTLDADIGQIKKEMRSIVGVMKAIHDEIMKTRVDNEDIARFVDNLSDRLDRLEGEKDKPSQRI